MLIELTTNGVKTLINMDNVCHISENTNNYPNKVVVWMRDHYTVPVDDSYDSIKKTLRLAMVAD